MCGWPPDCKGLSREAAGRLQSCVRPFGAVLMTAGPDGFREPSPYQLSEPMGSLTQTGSLGPAGSTAFAITRFYPRKLAAPWLGGSCRCCHGPVLFSLLMTAQAMRGVLFANATVATSRCFRRAEI